MCALYTIGLPTFGLGQLYPYCNDCRSRKHGVSSASSQYWMGCRSGKEGHRDWEGTCISTFYIFGIETCDERKNTHTTDV